MLGRNSGSARAPWLAAVGLCLAAPACQRPSVGERVAVAADVGPSIVLEDAWLDLYGHVVATFTASQEGLPLALEEVKALAPRFTLATLADHPVDGFREWRSELLTGSQVAPKLPTGGPGSDPEILTSARQPGYETTGTFVDLGDGHIRYVFASALTTFDPRGTVRVGVWLDSAPTASLDTSSTYDFCPSGGPVERRDTVRDENCARCHGTLVHHGRSRVRLCLTCHTWQHSDPDTIDPASMSTVATSDPNPLELGRLVHRIHRGTELPTLYQSSSTVVDPDPLNTTANLPLPFSPENSTTLLVGRKFSVVGKQSEPFVFGEAVQRTTSDGLTAKTIAAGVTFPRDLRDCNVCHDGADPENATTATISRRSCAGCHPDIWFGTTPITDQAHLAHPGGPQANDSQCKGCHIDPTGTSAPKLYAPITGPSSAHVPIAKSARHDMPITDIVSITGLVPGGAPVIRFKLRDRVGFIGPKPSAPVPATEPASETSSPVARALISPSGSLTIRITGPGTITGPGATDYTSVYGFPIASGSAGNPDARLLTDTGGTDPEYVYTFVSTIPATATGTWVVAMEARRSLKVVPHYTKDAQGKPDTFNWPYTGETVNETAENPIAYVDTATGRWPPDGPAPRRKVVAQEKCLRCHGRIEFHGGGARHEVALCVMCHAPDKTDYGGRSKVGGFVNLGATYDGLEERSLHFKVMIHRIHTGGRKGPASLEGIAPFVMGRGNFFDGIFPNDLRNCTLCHEGKSYLVEAIPTGAPPTIANETPTIQHPANSAVHSEGEPSVPPIQAACTGCHATGATFAHVESKTVGGVETCAQCHAKGTVSVEVVHGLAPPTGGVGATFSSIVQGVLVPRCATAACHSGNPPVASPRLDAEAAYAALVGVQSGQAGLKLVEPGAPEQSYLVFKLRGDAASAGGTPSTPMPPGDILDPADLAAIEAWIANGAPND